VCRMYRYDVALLRNDSDWLANSGPAKTLAIRNGAVLTVVVQANETNVGSLYLLLSSLN